ncbi:DHH family phosphoesterase [Nocardia mangyaensis]|uniref:DHH family phosphoesterase n=1 Tax=Nocardia mangyaensis TaxID=2213200 RepID=UPI002674E545|nr:bifunctional oligoribonuclease/PAP phosphatase NrnA [Nocardia mangyaensis]MDO3651238.1 bifunctional oligoribonuclease/PAP phosphatase NrnA [Nocardia mangyaensis]
MPGRDAGTRDGTALDAAVAALAAARSVTVLCHVQPDADTVGSGLALALAVHRRGVPVRVSFAEPAELPASLRTLPGTEHLVPPAEVPDEVDLLIVVDCGARSRLGALADRLPGARSTLVIDHHRANDGFGTVDLIDESAASTTELITRLLDAWGIPIDAAIAHCLFAGLVTDTGSFRWARPGSHALAERLLATGIDGAEITRVLLDTHPFAWLPMLSKVLSTAVVVPSAAGVGLVYALVRAADTHEVGPEEVESVIDVIRTTTEAGIAAVFKEARGHNDRWTVSLRSRDSAPGTADGVDVAAVASGFGGGGHRFAAGYTTYGSAESVVRALVTALG